MCEMSNEQKSSCVVVKHYQILPATKLSDNVQHIARRILVREQRAKHQDDRECALWNIEITISCSGEKLQNRYTAMVVGRLVRVWSSEIDSARR